MFKILFHLQFILHRFSFNFTIVIVIFNCNAHHHTSCKNNLNFHMINVPWRNSLVKTFYQTKSKTKLIITNTSFKRINI